MQTRTFEGISVSHSSFMQNEFHVLWNSHSLYLDILPVTGLLCIDLDWV